MWHRLWVFILGIWTLLGLFFTSQLYLISVNTARPVPFLKALAWQMSAVCLFALVTPLVLWLSRRFRIERKNWLRHLLIHAAAGTLVAAVLGFSHALIDTVYARGFSLTLLYNLPRMAFYLLDKELLVYWLIVLMSHAFDYYNRYRSEELKASHLATQLVQAQLQALKTQLHPHFLFNTLNAISELTHINPDAADAMITRLSDMLRISLEKTGVQEVTLKQELDFLEKYLAIEQMRFGDRLRIDVRVQRETLGALVPNMILQPLVENAIRHGIAPRAGGGRIEILAERADHMLRLHVSDDGHGFTENVVSPTRSSGMPVQRNPGNGVGLCNTRARLTHLYGARGRFELRPALPHGLTVCISIPFRESSSEDDPRDTSTDH